MALFLSGLLPSLFLNSYRVFSLLSVKLSALGVGVLIH